MNRKRMVFLMAAVLALSSFSFAQIGIKFRGSSGWCVGDRYDQSFIVTSQEVMVGQVLSIDTITPLRDMSAGIQLMLKTDREEIKVHLGPTWFVLNQDINLSVNDKNIEVRGCRTMIDGKPVLMASMLVRKDKMLILRDNDGIPYWCAWRPRFR